MEQKRMKQYEVFELCFRGETPEEPARVAPEVTFYREGEAKTVKGFYAGEGMYKVRYYPVKAGDVTWKVTSDEALEGPKEGSTFCEAADEDRHGIVRVNGLHFAYEDGTRYQAFGTTVYALVHQDRELIERTFDSLKKAPFNKIRFCVFPKDYAYNKNEPEYFAFEKTGDRFDPSKPCYAFWDALEERIRQLDRLGIQGDLILFHPYDRWGFSKLTFEECMTYLDYLVRRLAAFPNLWWSLANEYDIMGDFERPWWDEFAKFMGENDPYGHLLSNHNCLPYWDFHNKYTTHLCLQDIAVNRVGALQREYGKPVVFDEVCYEGNIEYTWGNISGFEMAHRFWVAHILGGYCTHGETYLNDEEILWWSRGGYLRGSSPERIAFLRKIMEELPSDPEVIQGFWDRLKPEEVLATPMEERKKDIWVDAMASLSIERFYRLIDRDGSVQSHCGDEVYLYYYGHQCCAKNNLELPEEYSYDIEVIDIWEMTRKIVAKGVSGKYVVELPGKEGIAVIARKVN